jgi:hypothetical protein
LRETFGSLILTSIQETALRDQIFVNVPVSDLGYNSGHSGGKVADLAELEQAQEIKKR